MKQVNKFELNGQSVELCGVDIALDSSSLQPASVLSVSEHLNLLRTEVDDKISI